KYLTMSPRPGWDHPYQSGRRLESLHFARRAPIRQVWPYTCQCVPANRAMPDFRRPVASGLRLLATTFHLSPTTDLPHRWRPTRQAPGARLRQVCRGTGADLVVTRPLLVHSLNIILL